ncbi:MAG TPA: hypothetical protein VNM47_17900 [Terriglobia bacterium]|nr:hypothetical protein [Terriglobia bacterium]
MLKIAAVYSLSLSLLLLAPAGAPTGCPSARRSCAMGQVARESAMAPHVAAQNCCRVLPAPNQNRPLQTESLQASELVGAGVPPIAAWSLALKPAIGRTPILPLNEWWTPPLSPLAQTSLLRL